MPYVNALFSLPYPGSVSIRRGVVEEYLFDLLASFASDGFAHLVLASQHADPPPTGPPTASASASTKSTARGQSTASSAWSSISLRTPSPLGLPGLDPRGEAHAGVFETAPMLYLQERLVKERLAKELPPMPIEFSQMEGAESFRGLGNGLGYTGDLSRATAGVGGRIVEHYAGRFKDLVLRHVGGEDVHDALRFSGF